MAFSDLVAKIQYPPKTTTRYKRLDGFRRALDGTLFKHLTYPFEQEQNGQNDIPIKERRPSIYYNIFKLLVDQTSSLTFGEAHAPSIRVNMDPGADPKKSADVHTSLELLVETLHLDALMIKAMNLGSPGSLLIILRALPDKSPYMEFVEGQYCTPMYEPEDPRKIKQVTQIYSLTAEDLRLAGYEGKYEDSKLYYIKIVYDKQGKRASMPMEQKRYENIGEKDEKGVVIQWVPDEERSWTNPFDFVPVLWVKNLDLLQGVDGAPTIAEEIISISIEISYMLSQSGRGYQYTADPIMMMKEGQLRTTIPLGGTDDTEEDTFFRSPAKMLRVASDGDAKMLEISAQGLKASDEHVAILREYALELASGMKSESKDTGGMQSCKALEMLHASLVWLVEKFRTSYGEMCFLPLVQMIVEGLKSGTLQIDNIDIKPLTGGNDLVLRLAWPEWSTPTGADMQAEMDALATGVGSTPTLPVPFITVEMAGQKAASILGFGDQNRAAAQVMQAHEENPPLTAREQHEADQKNEQQKIANDHENKKALTNAKIENDKVLTKGKVADNTHVAHAKAHAVKAAATAK